MARYHGVTSNTYERFLLDSGAVYKNYGEVGELLLGATQGGSSVTVEREIRNMEVDGARGRVKGADRIVSSSAKLSVNLKEFTTENLKLALPGSTHTDETTYDKIVAALSLESADYPANIAIVAQKSGNDTQPFVAIFKNPLASGNLDISLADKEESTVAIEFEARFDPAALDTEPWEIWNPTTA